MGCASRESRLWFLMDDGLQDWCASPAEPCNDEVKEFNP